MTVPAQHPETQASLPTASGLDDVVFAETKLSEVDGQQGKLVIAGYDVEELAGRVSFATVCALLWGDGLQGAGRVEAGLGQARVRAAALLPTLGRALALPDGMDALRAALAQLTAPLDADRAAERDLAVLVAGAVPVYTAAWVRARQALAPLAPDPSASHAADALRLITGKLPSLAAVQALDTYLVTVSDHGLNASTFAARVVASTGSDLVSAVVAATCALKGPLHGGAPGPVLSMLDAIGVPEAAEAWLETELRAERRIMGMGHRIYRVRDPRAAVFEAATQRLEASGARTPRLALARAVEVAAVGVLARRYPQRSLKANVEFYTAVLLDAVGLPREAFAPTFAAGRIAGWCAHVAEQRLIGRLVRPASRYVGGRYSLA